MLPLKLVRSLVLGETLNHHPHTILTKIHHHHHQESESESEDDDDQEANGPHHHQTSAAVSSRTQLTRTRKMRRRGRRRRRSKTPGLLFLPTREIITDTHRLTNIARQLGFDLFPTPSLSHIIFSYNPSPLPPNSKTLSSSSSTPSTPSTSNATTCSFSSSSSSWPLQSDAVPIPFPSISSAPLTHLRHFVNLASPAFKLVFFDSGDGDAAVAGAPRSWDCSSLSLYSLVTGERVDDMEGFCRVLASKGWTFFKIQKRPPPDRRVSGGEGGDVYLFRKVDVNRVRVGRVGGAVGPDGACRVRELRLPHLDFGNAPLRILQYILLMTDDVFSLV